MKRKVKGFRLQEAEASYFVDPNSLRLSPVSLCLNAFNPYLDYTSQLDMNGSHRVFGMYVDIGAYEVVCEDVANDYDWNADGIINLHEFNLFSRAWLSHDPNDPAWVADPNLSDPNLVEAWNPMCNLADTGNSQYTIDLADLLVFLEDAPWLWKACWRADIRQSEKQMFSGGEQMMAMGIVIPAEAGIRTVSEKTTQEQLLDLVSLIVRLEHIWLEQPYIQQEIDADQWRRFMDAVYHDLYMLQIKSVQIK